MNILGLDVFHGDSFAAQLGDGAFRSGVAEGWLNRGKHFCVAPGLTSDGACLL